MRARIQKLLVVLSIIMPLLGSVSPVAANTYGSGSYNACTYGQGCPTSTPSSNPSPSGSSILLNDFAEYFTASGKTLDLKVKQVVYFDLTENDHIVRHSVTVKEIGINQVVLTITSSSFDTFLLIGDKKQYDVSNDGQSDIEIALNGIANQVATLTFRQLSPAKPPTAATGQTKPKSSFWLLVLSLVSLGLGILIFLILFWRRRRQREPGPY